MIFGRNRRTTKLENVANARVGNALSVDGTRGHIRGTILFEEDDDTWVEHLIVAADESRFWMSIENFDETIATRWQAVLPTDVSGGPADPSVSYQGRTFKRSETGTAHYRAGGGVDLPGNGTIDYSDFSDGDGGRVSYERFGDTGAGRRTITAGSCPGCGAPLLLDQLNRCRTCGATPTVDHGEWSGWEASFGRDVSDGTELA